MSHACLRYHIIVATKRRQRLISPGLELLLLYAIRQKVEELGGTVVVLGASDDHTHWLVAIPSTIAVAEFVRQVKGYSSYLVNRERPRTRFKWQRGYAAFTVTPVNMDRLVRYIRHQRERHRRRRLHADWELPDSPG